MKEYAPIVLFVYNRPEHTRLTIDALQKNDLAVKSDLFIFADGPKEGASDEQLKKVKSVRDYIATIKGFKNINVELSEKNKGLARSVIYGVSKIVNKYGRIIVLEDDMITSMHLLQYLNQSLEIYQDDEDVVCINGFSLIKDAPIKGATYFQYGADCGCWATWKRGWDLFNPDSAYLQQVMIRDKKLRKIFTYNDSFPYMEMLQDQIDGKVDSWAIRWYASAVIKHKLCLYPKKSLIQNIGFGSEGTHCKEADAYEASIEADNTTTDFPKIEIKESKIMRREWEKLFLELYHNEKPSLWKKVKRMIKRML